MQHKNTSKEVTQTVKKHLLNNCIGIGKSILMNDLALKCDTNARQIRYAVRELRRENPFNEYFLVSNFESGYWLTKDHIEISIWLNGFLSHAYDVLKTSKYARVIIKHKMDSDSLNLFKDVLTENLQRKV